MIPPSETNTLLKHGLSPNCSMPVFPKYWTRALIAEKHMPSGKLLKARICLQFIAAGGSYDLSRSSGVIVQIADALHYLHTSRRTHGNRHPKNILMTADGSAVLTKKHQFAESERSARLLRHSYYSSPETGKKPRNRWSKRSIQFGIGTLWGGSPAADHLRGKAFPLF